MRSNVKPRARSCAMMGRSARAKMEREFDRVKVVEAYLEEARRALKNQHKEVAKDV